MEILSQLFSIDLSSATIIMMLKIILIDMILSGDNAVIIAMATRKLDPTKQNKAIVLGTVGAVVLRIFFAFVVVKLLNVPFVTLIAGVLLLWISYKVLVGEEDDMNVNSQNNLTKAIVTIISADAIMSLDNVVAVAGASHGNILLIAIGVIVSIPIMIIGAKIIMKAITKYTWISYVGAAILAWTASEMIYTDYHVIEFFHISKDSTLNILSGAMTALLLVLGYMNNVKRSVKY